MFDLCCFAYVCNFQKPKTNARSSTFAQVLLSGLTLLLMPKLGFYFVSSYGPPIPFYLLSPFFPSINFGTIGQSR